VSFCRERCLASLTKNVGIFCQFFEFRSADVLNKHTTKDPQISNLKIWHKPATQLFTKAFSTLQAGAANFHRPDLRHLLQESHRKDMPNNTFCKMQFEPSNSSLHFIALPLGTNTSHSYLLSSTPAATNSSLNNFINDARA
jgi:hypothetical protein